MTLEGVLRWGFAVRATFVAVGLIGLIFRLIAPRVKSEQNRAYYLDGRFVLPMKVAKLLPVTAPLTAICLVCLSLLD